MELKLGDVQTTALIPLAVKANETLRKNARIKDHKAVEIIRTLKIDTAQYDKFMSHEGVIARTIMLDRQLKGIIKKYPDTAIVNVGAGFDCRMDQHRQYMDVWRTAADDETSERRTQAMYKTTVKIDGMMCGMCESHVNDAIRSKMSVKKVTSSHKKGETVIISENELSTEMITAALDGSGYTVMSVTCGPYEKKGFFSRK